MSQIQPIAVYEPFKAQIIELKKFDAEKSFDYETPSGNKEARSHVYKLRQTRSAVEKARKEAKAESLNLGRRIDAEAKAIDAEIEALIERHDSKLREIENRETVRTSAIQKKIEDISSCGVVIGLSSTELKTNLSILEAIVIDASFEEFAPQAVTTRDTCLQVVRDAIVTAEKAEADKAELDRLRAEKAALDKAAREKEVAEAAVEAERKRVAKAAADAAAEEAKREANKKHRASVHKKIITAFTEAGMDDEEAKELVGVIADGGVPELKIVY
jgi:hypothetical protein